MKRKLAAFQNKAAPGVTPQASSSPRPAQAAPQSKMPSSQISDIARRVAEAKAKKAVALAQQGPINPYVVRLYAFP